MWEKLKGKGRICCCVTSLGCLLTSVILLIVPIVLLLEVPSIMTNVVEKKLTIKPGNTPFEQLQNPSLPVYKDVYFFNLTNPKEFHEGVRPYIQEVGPYSYREYRNKYFNESNLLEEGKVLEYTQLKTFHFSPETSQENASESDTICTLNIPLVGAIHQALEFDGIVRELAILTMKGIFLFTGAKLYVCQPATDLIFHYTDPLVKELHKNIILRLMGKNLPTDYVSIQLNASVNDSYPSRIHTGIDDISKVGGFIQWDGLTDLGVWPEESANMINGTEGLIFRPNLKEGDDLVAFVDDTLRSFPLSYSKKVKINGLDAFQYILPSSIFDSAFENPDNARWGGWCPNGFIYLGVLQKPNVPVFGSKARFLDCAPEQGRDQVDGMLDPVREEHDTFLNVHPTIGVNIQFQRVLQLNVQINQTNSFNVLKNINGTIYFPVFYINEHAELTDDFKNYLQGQGLRELQIATDVSYGMYAVLFLAALVAAVIALVTGCRALTSSKTNEYEAIR